MARAKPRKLVGAPAPEPAAAQLERELAKMVRQIRATAPKISGKGDLVKLGAALKREWSDARLRELVGAMGARVEAQGSKPWIRAQLVPEKRKRKDGERFDADGYNGRKLVEGWTSTAFKLIASVRDEVSEGMRKDLIEAFARGETVDQLAAKWRRQGIPLLFGTLEGRIKVIAQHQMRSLHAEVQRARASSVGVTEFFWRTQGDDKVRRAHEELADTRHDYADPPSEGLPGTPVNCRCWAESIISDAVLGSFGLRGVIAA